MCGIVGFNWQDKELLQRMTKVLFHRGPDEDGFFEDNNISLGQRRLSIIDLNTGKQPISNEDNSVWVICNGEIYNYKELRTELEQQGHHFKTQSDTEVLVHAYEQYGEQFLSRLNGMFGLAIWDQKEKKLLLARDRIGIKPLHYYHKNNQFLFASEIKAILQHKEVKRELNKTALNQFLTYAYTINGETLFKDIYELLPGHYLTFQNNNVNLKKYWDLKVSPTDHSLEYYAKELRNHLESAVKYRLISDVPVGAFLSGGLDSSIIVALMSKYMDKKMNTFCVGFNDPSDETKYARIVAEHCNTNHHEVIVDFAEVTKNLGKILWHMEAPIARASAFCLYFLSQEAKKKVTVIPVGEGADELFAGYNRDIPSLWKGTTIAEKAAEIIPGYFREEEKELFFQAGALNDLPHEIKPLTVFQSLLGVTSTEEDANYALLFETKTELPGLQLFRSDRMSMAHAIETRVPFLDHNLVEFAMTIPAKYKAYQENGKLSKKHVLKEAAKDLLPPEILERKKIPLGMPQIRFYYEGLQDIVKKVLLDEKTKARGLFKIDHIKELIESTEDQNTTPLTSPQFRQLLFLTNLELWHRLFIDNDELFEPNLETDKLIAPQNTNPKEERKMKAIIMAAGKGTRMQKVHGDVPKGTIPIGNTSVLQNMIKVLNENGIHDVIVVGGYKIDLLRKHIGDKATVIYNPLYNHGDDITSLWVGQHLLDQDFIYFHGDAVFGKEFISKLVNDPRERVMLVEKKECDKEDSKVLVKDGKVQKVSKKVFLDHAYGEFVGIAKFSGSAVKSFIHSLNEVVEKSGIENYESETIQHMIEKGEEVHILHAEHPWCEIDFPHDLDYALENKDKFGL